MKFKQFLLESRSAPLYHGTYADLAASILNQGYIAGETVHTGEVTLAGRDINGISTSRDKSYSWWYCSKVCMFVLDQQKISNDYRIIPVNFGTQSGGARDMAKTKSKSPFGSEFEEFIVTDKLPVKYITSIIFNPNKFSHQEELELEMAAEKCKIPLITKRA